MMSAMLRRSRSEPESAEPIQQFSSRAQAAEYIAVEASRLARLANTEGFALLAYLVDMAVLEAWREATEPEPQPEPSSPLGPGADPEPNRATETRPGSRHAAPTDPRAPAPEGRR